MPDPYKALCLALTIFAIFLKFSLAPVIHANPSPLVVVLSLSPISAQAIPVPLLIIIDFDDDDPDIFKPSLDLHDIAPSPLPDLPRTLRARSNSTNDAAHPVSSDRPNSPSPALIVGAALGSVVVAFIILIIWFNGCTCKPAKKTRRLQRIEPVMASTQPLPATEPLRSSIPIPVLTQPPSARVHASRRPSLRSAKCY